jgi:hypothetical protein
MIAGQEYWCITTGTPLNGTITLMTLGDYRSLRSKGFRSLTLCVQAYSSGYRYNAAFRGRKKQSTLPASAVAGLRCPGTRRPAPLPYRRV